MEEENAHYNGKVAYNKDIVKSIINLAAREINGVSGVEKAGKLYSLFRGKYDKGVKITNTKDGLVIDVYVNIYSNTKVNEIAWRIQENIRTAVQSMVDIKVKSVNVNVIGVDFSNIEAEDRPNHD